MKDDELFKKLRTYDSGYDWEEIEFDRKTKFAIWFTIFTLGGFFLLEVSFILPPDILGNIVLVLSTIFLKILLIAILVTTVIPFFMAFFLYIFDKNKFPFNWILGVLVICLMLITTKGIVFAICNAYKIIEHLYNFLN